MIASAFTPVAHPWRLRLGSSVIPAVASAVGSLKVQSCCIDGEVVVCDEAGRLLGKFCHATHGTNWRH
jgi:hypothetical protein